MVYLAIFVKKTPILYFTFYAIKGDGPNSITHFAFAWYYSVKNELRRWFVLGNRHAQCVYYGPICISSQKLLLLGTKGNETRTHHLRP